MRAEEPIPDPAQVRRSSPSVSVVIPTYNRRELVMEAIDSVFAAEGDAEVIVVDDGSTDGTEDALIGRYGKSIRLLSQPNSGRSTARNRGVAAASGDFVNFLDSDDLWEPWHLAQFRAFAPSDQQVAIYSAPVALWDETSNALLPTSRAPAMAPASNLLLTTLVGTVLPLEGLFVPRGLLREVPFDPLLQGSEDWVFVALLVRRAAVVHLARPSIRARLHSGRSMSDVDWDIHWRARAAERLQEHLHGQLSAAERVLIEAGTARYRAARLYEVGRYDEARSELAKLRQLLPRLAGWRATADLSIQMRLSPVLPIARWLRSVYRRMA